jgi:hypothetical protein
MLGGGICVEAAARLLPVPHIYSDMPHRHHVCKCRSHPITYIYIYTHTNTYVELYSFTFVFVRKLCSVVEILGLFRDILSIT